MTKAIDITGQRYGRLTAIRLSHRTKYVAYWLCKCDCGNEVLARLSKLRSGRKRSCGCLHRDTMTTHGMSKTNVYKVWNAMRQRCENTRATHYDRYGGRGITVCDRWVKFENFIADMGNPGS